ncbi:MAG: FimV/HubP family polar landmark protein, partial [Ectothiorhodospira sp.]
MRRLALGTAVWALVAPGSTYGLGLGEIEARSALNQPLRAEIELVSVDPREVEDLVVRLAPQALYERMGIPRPPVLTRLEFEPVALPDGGYRIRVTSDRPVREPFLNFLVEASWPNGRLVREYTLLLDPPARFEQSRPTPTQAAAPDRGDAGGDGGEEAAESPSTHRVRAGDTLWSLGQRLRPDGDITVEQMMMALMEANPEAFGDGNINHLRRGFVLRVPDREELTRLSPEEARQAVARQNEDWEEGRRQASGPTPAAADGEDEAEGSEPATAQEEGSPSPVEEVVTTPGLEIVAREAEDEGEVERLRRELALVRETTESRRQEAEELRDRIQELESLLDRQSRLLAVTNEQLARLQARMGPEGGTDPQEISNGDPGEETSSGQGADASGQGDAPGPAPGDRDDESPGEQSTPSPSPPSATGTEREPGLLGSILRSPALLVGIGSAILLFGALLLLLLRRLRGTPPQEAGSEASLAPTEPSPVGAQGSGLATGAGLATSAGAVPPPAPVTDEAARSEAGSPRTPLTGNEPPAGATAPQPGTPPGVADSGAGEMGAHALPTPTGQFPGTPETPEPPRERPSGSAVEGQNLDEVTNDDTIAEADVYLAYGLHRQARELLESALKQDPERLDYHYKLAETHFAESDAEGFEQVAYRMHERLGGRSGGLWDRVVGMGQELIPESPLFGGHGEAAAPGEPVAEVPPGFGAEDESPGRQDPGHELDETLLQPPPQDERGTDVSNQGEDD